MVHVLCAILQELSHKSEAFQHFQEKIRDLQCFLGIFANFLHLPVHALSCQPVKILGLTEPKAAWGGLKMVSQNFEDTVLLLPVMRLISSPRQIIFSGPRHKQRHKMTVLTPRH